MKCYYSISEVSKKTNVKPYVLRYWEQEFKELHPKKTKGGRRKYTSQDIDLICLIKKLLHEEHYTIEGVKKIFKNREEISPMHISSSQETHARADKSILKEVEKGLNEILNILAE